MKKELLSKLYHYFWDIEELKSIIDIELIIDCDEEYIYLKDNKKLNVEGDII